MHSLWFWKALQSFCHLSLRKIPKFLNILSIYCIVFSLFLWSMPVKNNNHFFVGSYRIHDNTVHCVIMYSGCTSTSCLQATVHMHFTHCKFDNFSFTSVSCHFSFSAKLRTVIFRTAYFFTWNRNVQFGTFHI